MQSCRRLLRPGSVAGGRTPGPWLAPAGPAPLPADRAAQTALSTRFQLWVKVRELLDLKANGPYPSRAGPFARSNLEAVGQAEGEAHGASTSGVDRYPASSVRDGGAGLAQVEAGARTNAQRPTPDESHQLLTSQAVPSLSRSLFLFAVYTLGRTAGR
jgi:hypothetical protein